jgi:hypothetical protein
MYIVYHFEGKKKEEGSRCQLLITREREKKKPRVNCHRLPSRVTIIVCVVCSRQELLLLLFLLLFLTVAMAVLLENRTISMIVSYTNTKRFMEKFILI